MIEIKKLFEKKPYGLSEKDKNKNFLNILNKLTIHHYKKSENYRKILKKFSYNPYKKKSLDQIPFLPVRIFKEFDLISVRKKQIIKTLISSGTTNNGRSKIYLDKENAVNQIKALQKIIHSLLGKKERIPMLIIDQDLKNINRTKFSARVAAINGFSMFGKDHTFALDSEGNIDYQLINNFLKKNKGKKFLIFGFTSQIFKYLIEKLSKKLLTSDLSNSILLHGGGWKKLEKIKISNNIFKKKLKKKFNIKNVFNYYGLVEQTGSIFMECRCGYFIASNYSDILVRDINFNVLKYGQKGFLQLFSLLPTSYPGHSLLTEDIGELVDNKKCKCSLNGKRFLVHGRFPKAEIRGCSNI